MKVKTERDRQRGERDERKIKTQIHVYTDGHRNRFTATVLEEK